MSKSSAPRASESSASASSSKTGDSDPTGTGTSSSASDGDGADPASLSDAERSEIAADARAVATAGGKTVRDYTYCVAAKGDVAREVLGVSRDGLKSRNRLNAEGQDESIFLASLEEVLAKKSTLADDLLALYHGRWNGKVDPVFDEYQY